MQFRWSADDQDGDDNDDDYNNVDYGGDLIIVLELYASNTSGE